MNTTITADQLARFDQAYAETCRALDDLIAVHREELAEHRYELCVAGLSHFLTLQSDIGAVSQMLATAVHRLAGAAA